MIDARTWNVMLADSGACTDDEARRLASQGYVFDMKWDGVRCMIVKDAAGTEMFNRKGEPFGYRYPEIITAVNDHFGDVVLDGEVIIFDKTGKPEFTLTSQRALGPARTKDIARLAVELPGTFVAFDMLGLDGTDLRNFPQVDRFRFLDEHLSQTMGPNNRHLVRSIRSADGVRMLDLCRTQGLEGVIAKNSSAPYRAGRSRNWVKMKPTSRVTCIVTGWDEGEGKRSATFGALHIAVLDAQGALVDIGKVGTGFTDKMLATLDPFVRAGKAPLVEVEYQNRQPGTGVLRFPSFKGVRFDLDREAASIDQFESA